MSAIGGRKYGLEDSPEIADQMVPEKPMRHYKFLCNNCKFWEVGEFGNIGICTFVSEQNKWAYLVHPGGRCLMTTFDFWCKGHEFKDL